MMKLFYNLTLYIKDNTVKDRKLLATFQNWIKFYMYVDNTGFFRSMLLKVQLIKFPIIIAISWKE